MSRDTGTGIGTGDTGGTAPRANGASIRAVLFDLDETLLADAAGTQGALLATGALAQARIGVAAETLAQAVWRHAQRLWATAPEYTYCEQIGISAGEGLWGRFLGDDPHLHALAAWAPSYQREAWALGLGECGCDTPTLAEELAARFREERQARHTLFPEAEDVLRHLRANAQYRLGLVTNGAPDIQRDKISGAGIARYFDLIVVSGEIGIGKPARGIYTHTLAALGLAPAETVMVGDNRVNDVWGAQQLGIRGMWIDRDGYERAPADGIIPDATLITLKELPAALAAVG